MQDKLRLMFDQTLNTLHVPWASRIMWLASRLSHCFGVAPTTQGSISTASATTQVKAAP